MKKRLSKEFTIDLNSLETKHDLVVLLNKIHETLNSEVEVTKERKEYFSEAYINYCLINLKRPIENSIENVESVDQKKLYESFEVIKKSGGTRIINAPIDSRFKELLRCLDYFVRSVYVPHKSATGFIDQKSIVENAKVHLNKNYVYNVDIKDFFHSFDLNRVKLSLFNKPFIFKDSREPVAYIIASLVTCNIAGKRVLPQGSPVSPALTNHICYRLDHRLSGLAKRFGADYSRYADDITFSSNRNIYRDDFISELKRIINNESLVINEKKTRLHKKDERQEVTGLTVNDRLNVSRKYIKDLRMYLYYANKYGVEKAQQIYYKDFQLLKQENRSWVKPPKISLILKGKLNFLSMVKGKDDPVFLKLQSKYNSAFPTSTSRIQQVIKIWNNQGINEARDFYYTLKNGTKFLESLEEDIDSKIYNEFNFSEFNLISSKRGLLSLYNLSKKDFLITHNWQYKDSSSALIDYEKELNRIVYNFARTTVGLEILTESNDANLPFDGGFYASIDRNNFNNDEYAQLEKFLKEKIEENSKYLFSLFLNSSFFGGEELKKVIIDYKKFMKKTKK